jgi:predicted nucleic acid-binding protein
LKVLVDTNVILDAVAAREPFRQSAEKIILMAAEEKIEGFISAKSVADIYYITRKHLPETATRKALGNLFRVFSILALLGDDCQSALESQVGDYEDAILAACGRRSRMDYVITRDEDFLRSNGPIRTISPAGFLKMYSKLGLK